jgi:hypothetical protein
MLVRRARVLELKVQGLSNRAIAGMLDPPVSYETVRKDVAAVLEELAEETRDNADRLRALDLGRLDKAIRVCLGFVTSEAEEPSVRLQAVEKLAKLTERRAKLLGLDAPERHEVAGDMTLTPAAVSGAVREVFRELGSRSDATGEDDAGAAPDAQPLP